jgi:hypothetical protein
MPCARRFCSHLAPTRARPITTATRPTSDLAPVKEHAVDPLPAPPSQAFPISGLIPPCGWADLRCGVPTTSGCTHGHSGGTLEGQSGSSGTALSSLSWATASDATEHASDDGNSVTAIAGLHHRVFPPGEHWDRPGRPPPFELPTSLRVRVSGVSLASPPLFSPDSESPSSCNSGTSGLSPTGRRKRSPLHGAEQAHIRFARAQPEPGAFDSES